MLKGWERIGNKLIFSKQYLLLAGLKFIISLATFPYYRMFQFNTYQPIILIAAYTATPGKCDKVLYHLDRWYSRKLAELQFVSIGVSQTSILAISYSIHSFGLSTDKFTRTPFQSAILAAATIGSFSWSAVNDAYWLASAFWYSSLIFAFLGLLLAAQQMAVLQLLGKPPVQAHRGAYSVKEDVRRFLPLMLCEVRASGSLTDSARDEGDLVGKWRPRWKMAFIWQCPAMFMSYSICFFLAGLTLFVCTPLIRGDRWNTDSDVGLLACFLVSVSFAYRNVGRGGLLDYWSSRGRGVHVCVVLDLSLC